MSTRVLAIGNIVATQCFVAMTFIITLLCYYEILPYLQQYYKWNITYHRIIFAHVFVNAVGNFLLTYFVNTSVTNITSTVPNEYLTKDSCATCSSRVPVRAHHCVICDVCILRRDHHCFFTSVCIGYHNQKYFILYCLYVTVGAFYGFFMIVIYINKLYRIQFYGAQTLLLLLPQTLLECVQTDTIHVHRVSLVVLMYLCLLAGSFALAFLLWQLYISTNGQTTYEAWNGITTYRSHSKKRNLLHVFGKYWFINIIIPLPLSQRKLGLYKAECKKST